MSQQKVLVWDLPTRVFHWLLAISFAGAFLTADSEKLRAVHVVLGYTMLALLAFRLVWGILGTRYARFSSFAFAPREVLSHLRSLITFRPRHYMGHNPAGSWAIYTLFALGLLTGATGFANLNSIGGEWLGELHEAAANAFLVVVIVHIAGVLVSSVVHRENLVRSMLNGYKSGTPADGIRYRHRIVALALVLAVGALWLNADTLTSAGDARIAHADRHDAAHERDD